MKRTVALLICLAILSCAAIAETEAPVSYKDILTQLRETYTWPDGTAAADPETTAPEAFAENSFAVHDIDGDGTDELIVMIGSGAAAELQERVYRLKDGELTLCLTEYPPLVVLDNGLIIAYWSHNQTQSDFWPFTLYVYDAETGLYAERGSIYAEDKTYTGTEHPADEDGNGIVYYISAAGEYNTEAAVDDADADGWIGSFGFTDDTDEMEILWYPMTEENIASVTE